MKIYAVSIFVMFVFGVFWLGCADLEYGEYDDGEIIEVVEVDEEIEEKADNAPKASESSINNSNMPKVSDSKATRVESNKSTQNNIAKNAIVAKNLNKAQKATHKPQTSHLNQMQDLQNTKTSQDSKIPQKQNMRDLEHINKSTTKFSFNPNKLNMPSSLLESHCALGNLEHCEDLGRIYALQDKRNLAISHYKRACDSGKGRVMSCFFLSLIYANSGDEVTSGEYLDMISGLESHKIDEAELLLSIGEIMLLKDKLKKSCANGESNSCKTLSNILKIRGEVGELKAFLGK